MRYNLILSLILILLLVGCTKTIIQYKNVTIEKNITQIVYQNVTKLEKVYINNSCTVTYINPVKEVNRTVRVYNYSCEQKFSNCNNQLQNMFNFYQQCRLENNSQTISAINYSYNDAYKKWRKCNGTLENITKYLK